MNLVDDSGGENLAGAILPDFASQGSSVSSNLESMVIGGDGAPPTTPTEPPPTAPVTDPTTDPLASTTVVGGGGDTGDMYAMSVKPAASPSITATLQPLDSSGNPSGPATTVYGSGVGWSWNGNSWQPAGPGNPGGPPPSSPPAPFTTTASATSAPASIDGIPVLSEIPIGGWQNTGAGWSWTGKGAPTSPAPGPLAPTTTQLHNSVVTEGGSGSGATSTTTVPQTPPTTSTTPPATEPGTSGGGEGGSYPASSDGAGSSATVGATQSDYEHLAQQAYGVKPAWQTTSANTTLNYDDYSKLNNATVLAGLNPDNVKEMRNAADGSGDVILHMANGNFIKVNPDTGEHSSAGRSQVFNNDSTPAPPAAAPPAQSSAGAVKDDWWNDRQTTTTSAPPPPPRNNTDASNRPPLNSPNPPAPPASASFITADRQAPPPAHPANVFKAPDDPNETVIIEPRNKGDKKPPKTPPGGPVIVVQQ